MTVHPSPGLPPWCRKHTSGSPAHTRTIGQADTVGVTLIQAPTWKAPQVYITHWEAPGPWLPLDLRWSTAEATILSRLGHEGLATLIPMAVAVATGQPDQQPEAPQDQTEGEDSDT